MPRLILLNGPPGIGKSTLARRYAVEHPLTLCCDLDVLRRAVGGWREHFDEVGELVRTAALALVTAYLREGEDVVVPQMICRVTELELFEASATGAGAGLVEVLLMDEPDAVVARFHRRGAGTVSSGDPWHAEVAGIVADQGGDDVLLGCHEDLTALAALRPATRVVTSIDGDVEATYAAVLAAVGR